MDAIHKQGGFGIFGKIGLRRRRGNGPRKRDNYYAGMDKMAIGAAIGSAVIGASSASKAAKAQTNAANQQVGLQREIFQEQSANFSPFLASGLNAQNALNFELGLGERPTIGGTALNVSEVLGAYGGGRTGYRGKEGKVPFYSATRGPSTFNVGGQSFGTRGEADAYAAANSTGGQLYGGYQKTPGYDYRLQQGIDAIDASAAARGGLRSGAVIKAQQEHGQNFASNEYGNYINRLTGLASSGQNAAGQQAAAGQNYATGAGNALGSIGNAQAAGAIGVGNAFQSGISNIVGIKQYQNQLAGQSGTNSLFGGNSWGL